MDRTKTALVVIDLQKGITSLRTEPYDLKAVVTNCAKLAEKFRTRKMPVFLVHDVIAFQLDKLNLIADERFQMRGPPAKDWADFIPEIGPREGDIVITKNHWGAFYGTDLDPQLKARTVDTIVLCGVATNYGVESTARFAYEYGYQQIFAEDAMSSMTEEMHNFSVNRVLKRIGRVRSTAEILQAMER